MVSKSSFLYPITLKKFEEIASTNDYLKENKVQNWTFAWSEYQNKGRGQEGVWEAQKGKNLTFSFYLVPYKLSAQKNFLLNIFICNALHKTFCDYHRDLFIKWPNDLLLKNKKIAGILIENLVCENLIKSTVIGIGLNVNQMKFGLGFEKASSLKRELDIKFDLDSLFEKLVQNIQKEYKLLEESKIQLLEEYYLNCLYQRGIICSFKYKEEIIKATLVGIDNQGKLILRFEKEEKLRAFEQKEINLIY